MEQINTIELNNPEIFPDDHVLEPILGESISAYRKLLDIYKSHGLSTEWRYYRDGKSWLCKVQKKARTIVWMSAWKGYMQATVYIPAKHINGIYDLEISRHEKDRIKNTLNVGKSKPCSFDIKNQSDIPVFEKIMIYKLESK